MVTYTKSKELISCGVVQIVQTLVFPSFKPSSVRFSSDTAYTWVNVKSVIKLSENLLTFHIKLNDVYYMLQKKHQDRNKSFM